MNKEDIEKISDSLSDSFAFLSDEIQKVNTDYFTQYPSNIKSIEDWSEFQKKQKIKIYRLNERMIASAKKSIDKKIINATFLTLQSAIENEKLSKNELMNQARKKAKLNQEQFDSLYTSLLASSLLNYQNRINSVLISADKIDKEKVAITLRDQIAKTISTHGVSDAPSVIYKNGRKMSYKPYMEMNVRTTLSQTATNFQEEVGRALGVIFYLCDSYADCADDHKEYQGKMYYDSSYLSNCPDELKDKVAEFIKSRNLKSIQNVKDRKPYLTTRPNCRHRFTPIETTQALSISKEDLLKKFKLENGKYKNGNYAKTQEQRQNERNIRKYKQRKEELEILIKNDPENELAKLNLRKANALVKVWQKRNVQLVKQNPFLKRDYRREDIDRVINDIGFTYNQKTLKTK